MKVTENIPNASMKRFTQNGIKRSAAICSDEYRSYPATLTVFTHKANIYDPDGGLLNWLHIMTDNTMVFVLSTYRELPKANLQTYLDEFCYRFSRRHFEVNLFERPILVIASSKRVAGLKR